ncbi:CGNR zinc finger domain-containing protein [Amnibacterium sp. CER49]|nr:CGNR zinc finger domain-containing protein [Amnibacterium sp. CER49]MDH2445073.1 CGNR zinc finger domain-containing protein [Amnibacterium sp. CER49]
MVFTDDTEAVLHSAAALVNTEPGASRSDEDELTSVEDVAAFFTGWAYSGDLLRTQEELDALRELRGELRAFFTESRDEIAEHVNRVLAESHAVPRLVRHDAYDWHVHAVPGDAPFAERIRVETAMALADLVRADETTRLKVCAADDCTAVLVDLSRNRSKRFCDVGNCGNRMNVTAYRARRANAAG